MLPTISPVRLKNLQRVQHRFHARHLVRAEQIGLPKRRQDGEKRLGAPHFFTEVFEGVRQGVAYRPAQRPKPECVQCLPSECPTANGSRLPRPDDRSPAPTPASSLDKNAHRCADSRAQYCRLSGSLDSATLLKCISFVKLSQCCPAATRRPRIQDANAGYRPVPRGGLAQRPNARCRIARW